MIEILKDLFTVFTKDISRRAVIWTITFIVVFGLAFVYQDLMLSWPSPKVDMSMRDFDIWLRLAQVRQWITTPDFYNHLVTNTNAPLGGVSTPWTRPTDILLTALYSLTPSSFQIEQRLMLAATWLPALLAIGAIFFLSRAAECNFKNATKLGLVVLCGFFCQPAFYVFIPGNADHHNLQAFLWCVALFLFLAKPSPLVASAIGMVLGLWLWISPEALMLIAPLYAIWGIDALRTPSKSTFPMIASVSATVMAIIGLSVEKPLSDILTHSDYDTLSLPYIVLMALCAVGFGAIKLITITFDTLKQKIVSAALVGVALGGGYLLAFPKFIKGPLVDADPYIFTNYLPQIAEAQPLFSNGYELALSVLALPCLAVFLLDRFKKQAGYLPILFAAPLLMTLVQTRWFYYLEPVSILIIARFLPSYIRVLRRKVPSWGAPYLHPYLPVYVLYALLCLFIPLVAEAPEVVAAEDQQTACNQDIFYLLQSGELKTILGDAPITIETSRGNLGGAVLFFTPYKIMTANYHREGAALRVKDQIFDAHTADNARALLRERGVQALVICPSTTDSWLNAAFVEGGAFPDWIKRVDDVQFLSDTPPHPVVLRISP